MCQKEIAEKLAELERTVGTHGVAIRAIVEAIKRLAILPEPLYDDIAPPKDAIGFLPKKA